MPLPAIELQQLWKSYDGKPALQGLSLDAYPSEILGLIGPNGAGKTTTLKILVGLLRPDYGIVRVRGHDVLLDPVGYKAELGYMPEAPTLPEYLTPTEFLGYVGRIRNLSKDRIAARTSELLRALDLTPKADETIASLSKGMKAKVAFAAAIIHEPSILVLDEPLIGIDPAGQHPEGAPPGHGPGRLHRARLDTPARHSGAVVRARRNRAPRAERRDGRPRGLADRGSHGRGRKPRRRLPPAHPGGRRAGRGEPPTAGLVPERIGRESDPHPVHIQTSVLLRAGPPRTVRAA